VTARKIRPLEVPKGFPTIVRDFIQGGIRAQVQRNYHRGWYLPDIRLWTPDFPWDVGCAWYEAVLKAATDLTGPTLKVSHLPIIAIGSPRRFTAHGVFPVSCERRLDAPTMGLTLSCDQLREFT